MDQIQEFQSIYGVRFVGLEDPGALTWTAYSLPDPEAPYPRDVVIDQQGIVRYWSTEYDPQAIREVIRSLLGTASVDPDVPVAPDALTLEPVVPNPSTGQVQLLWNSTTGGARLEIFDPAGRKVYSRGPLGGSGPQRLVWDGLDSMGRRLPAGTYFARVTDRSGACVRRMIRMQ